MDKVKESGGHGQGEGEGHGYAQTISISKSTDRSKIDNGDRSVRVDVVTFQTEHTTTLGLPLLVHAIWTSNTDSQSSCFNHERRRQKTTDRSTRGIAESRVQSAHAVLKVYLLIVPPAVCFTFHPSMPLVAAC